MYFFPGLYSITTPYIDVSDFYFSGHIGSTTLIMSEFFASGWNKMGFFVCFVIMNEWMMLMFLRTHYIIDFVTGFILARLLHYHAEKLSYYLDIKCWGIPAEKRQAKYFKPCLRCGWSNDNAERFVDKKELAYQKDKAKGSVCEFAPAVGEVEVLDRPEED